jgi:hypothetical protein
MKVSKLEGVLYVLHFFQWVGVAICLPLLLFLLYALAIHLRRSRTKDKANHDPAGIDRPPRP